jgi:hypothetical protein
MVLNTLSTFNLPCPPSTTGLWLRRNGLSILEETGLILIFYFFGVSSRNKIYEAPFYILSVIFIDFINL